MNFSSTKELRTTSRRKSQASHKQKEPVARFVDVINLALLISLGADNKVVEGHKKVWLDFTDSHDIFMNAGGSAASVSGGRAQTYQEILGVIFLVISRKVGSRNPKIYNTLVLPVAASDAAAPVFSPW